MESSVNQEQRCRCFPVVVVDGRGRGEPAFPRGQDGQDGSEYRVNLGSTGCGRSLEKGQQPSAELKMNIFDKQIATGKRLNFFCGPFFVLFIWFWFGHVLNGL